MNQDIEVEADYVELWRWQPKENNRWNNGYDWASKSRKGRAESRTVALQ